MVDDVAVAQEREALGGVREIRQQEVVRRVDHTLDRLQLAAPQVVNDANVSACGDELLHQVRSDKSAAAGDDHACAR